MRKAAGGHRRERVTDGVVERHAGEHQGNGLRNRQGGVQLPQRDSRFPQLRCELVVGRPRRLGEKELAPSDGESRKHSDEQRDDAQAPEPLRQGPPEEHPSTEGSEIGEDRRAGCRQTGHRLEQGVDERHADRHVGKRRDVCDHQPGRRDDRQPLDASQSAYIARTGTTHVAQGEANR